MQVSGTVGYEFYYNIGNIRKIINCLNTDYLIVNNVTSGENIKMSVVVFQDIWG